VGPRAGLDIRFHIYIYIIIHTVLTRNKIVFGYMQQCSVATYVRLYQS
jgi:hypothetical protein